MGKDHCAGLYDHSLQPPLVRSYGGSLPDLGPHSVAAGACHGSDPAGYPISIPVVSAVPGFVAGESYLLNEQFQPRENYCHGPSIRPSNEHLQERAQACSHDCRLELEKLGLGSPLFRSQCCQKKFIVFDQSGSQRSMHLRSINSLSLPLPVEYAYRRSGDLLLIGPEVAQNVPAHGNVRMDEANLEESKILSGDEDSEMHENTDDLEALLCSEDEDDEAASTGHSPCNVIGHLRRERDEEVACSTVELKRRKLDEIKREVQENEELILDTPGSFRTCESTYSPYACDSESCCSIRASRTSISKEGSTQARGGKESVEIKRLRREKIKKTVGILSGLLPGGRRKDATAVLDEAIRYLRSLRLKVGALEDSKLR